MASCLDCGHEGCDGQECKGEFILTLRDGRMVHDCAICCREILAGEDHAVKHLARVASVFNVLAALTA